MREGGREYVREGGRVGGRVLPKLCMYCRIHSPSNI